MKIILGDSFLALSKIILTLFAPTPTYFSTNSEPLEYMKVAFASPATAFAINVLPVPGGPYSNIPRGTLASIDLYFSSLFKKSMTSIRSSLISSRPATSSKPICILGSSVFFFSKYAVVPTLSSFDSSINMLVLLLSFFFPTAASSFTAITA